MIDNFKFIDYMEGTNVIKKKAIKKTESKTIDEERIKEILKRTYNSNFLFFICYTRQNGSKNVSIIWNKLVSTKLDKLIYLLK